MLEKYFEVAVNAPLFQTFTYKLLTHADDNTNYSGKSVRIPFGKRTAEGVILKETTLNFDEPNSAENQISKDKLKEFKIKEISEISTDLVAIDPKYLDWLKWISEYYMYPLGQTVQNIFPPLKKRRRQGKKKNSHS